MCNLVYSCAIYVVACMNSKFHNLILTILNSRWLLTSIVSIQCSTDYFIIWHKVDVPHKTLCSCWICTQCSMLDMRKIFIPTNALRQQGILKNIFVLKTHSTLFRISTNMKGKIGNMVLRYIENLTDKHFYVAVEQNSAKDHGFNSSKNT